jgi:hypothetical protein
MPWWPGPRPKRLGRSDNLLPGSGLGSVLPRLLLFWQLLMTELAVIVSVTFVVMTLLALAADWALADFYFHRKWWSERP